MTPEAEAALEEFRVFAETYWDLLKPMSAPAPWGQPSSYDGWDRLCKAILERDRETYIIYLLNIRWDGTWSLDTDRSFKEFWDKYDWHLRNAIYTYLKENDPIP